MEKNPKPLKKTAKKAKPTNTTVVAPEATNGVQPPSLNTLALGGAAAVVACILIVLVAYYAFRGGIKHQGEPLVKAAPVAQPASTEEQISELAARLQEVERQQEAEAEEKEKARIEAPGDDKVKAETATESASRPNYQDAYASFARRGAEMNGLTVAVDSGVVARVEKLEKAKEAKEEKIPEEVILDLQGKVTDIHDVVTKSNLFAPATE